MNESSTPHMRGPRGQAFADLVRGIAPEHILCVSLDISKYFHVVMIHNGLGEIVTPTFDIDIYQTGFEQLSQAIARAKTDAHAQVVLVGMEPTSHYFENLAQHLLQQGQAVPLINSFAVKHNRDQQLMRREKTDQIDVAAIGDLLRRGEGTRYRPATGIYLALQQLDRVRLGKVRVTGILKNQIIGHLDRIFPGLLILDEAAQQRYTPLFRADFWACQTLQDLIRICPNPHDLQALPPDQLVQRFHAQHCRLGPKTAAKLIAQARKTLLPETDLVAIRCELLQHDLTLLEAVQAHLTQLEARLGELGALTPYHIWTHLKGLSVVQVASLAAAIGEPTNYTDARQVFRRSGLVSGRNDSGNRQRKGKGSPILKTGDIYLRRALMNATATLILHQPALASYNQRLQVTKPASVARVATARKALGILWAVLRDQASQTLLTKKGATL